MSCADVLCVRPTMMRRLGTVWEDAGEQIRREAATVEAVAASGIGDLGRVNQFMVPALAGFLIAAHHAAVACAETLEDAGEAARATGEDIRSTDEEIAEQVRSGDAVVQEVWA